MDILVGIAVIAAVGVSKIAEIIVAGSGFHFVCPGIRQTARGADLAGQDLRYTIVTAEAGQADPQSTVNIARGIGTGIGGLIDKAAFNGHGGIDQDDNILEVLFGVVHQSQLHILQLQIALSGIAASSICHIHDCIGAFTAGPTKHQNRGVRILFGAFQKIAVFLQRLLHDVVACAGHVGGAAGLTVIGGIVIDIELPQIRVYGDALRSQRVFQIHAGIRAPVPAAGRAGAQVDLLIGASAQ